MSKPTRAVVLCPLPLSSYRDQGINKISQKLILGTERAVQTGFSCFLELDLESRG